MSGDPNWADNYTRERNRAAFARAVTDNLESLARNEEDGIELVEWVDSNDGHVCPLCKARDGKRFTIAEARAIFSTDFCCARDGDDETEGPDGLTGCRCLTRPFFEDVELDPIEVGEEDLEATLEEARKSDSPIARIFLDVLTDRVPPPFNP